MAFDLILKGGRVIDPAQGLDAVLDVGFAGGRVAAVAPDLPAGEAQIVRDATGALVVPGLVDLHTHVYWGATSLGVEAEPIARRSATTTLVDAGSAGAGNYPGFRRFIVEPSPLRILAYLNISYAGIYGFSSTVMVGECRDIRLLDIRECARVAADNRDNIIGVKVRVGRHAGEGTGTDPLRMAIEAAEAVGLPVMAHIDFPPPGIDEVLELLRPGDVLTHCYRPFPNAPLDGAGQVRAVVQEARARGIAFDIGHGMGAFSFATARVMLDRGFLPDVISSDVHVLSVDGPAFDNLVTMSKFLCLGVGLSDIVRAATVTPARLLGRPDLGTLTPGSVGDAAVLRIREGDYAYVDVMGEVMRGDRALATAAIVVGGRVWHDAEA